jgi:hypothetical protein
MTTLVDPRLQSVTISVRSDDTDILADATGSNVRFRFSRNIQIPPGIRTLMTLTNAQIPNSWYALKTDTTLMRCGPSRSRPSAAGSTFFAVITILPVALSRRARPGRPVGPSRWCTSTAFIVRG